MRHIPLGTVFYGRAPMCNTKLHLKFKCQWKYRDTEGYIDSLISPKTCLLHMFLLNISCNDFLIRSSRKSFRCIKVGLGDPQDDSQDDSEEDRLGRCGTRAVTPFKTLDTLLDSSNKKSSSSARDTSRNGGCSFLILVCRGATQSKLSTTFYKLAVWKKDELIWAYDIYCRTYSIMFMFPLKQVSLWPKEYGEPSFYDGMDPVLQLIFMPHLENESMNKTGSDVLWCIPRTKWMKIMNHSMVVFFQPLQNEGISASSACKTYKKPTGACSPNWPNLY